MSLDKTTVIFRAPLRMHAWVVERAEQDGCSQADVWRAAMKDYIRRERRKAAA